MAYSNIADYLFQEEGIRDYLYYVDLQTAYDQLGRLAEGFVISEVSNNIKYLARLAEFFAISDKPSMRMYALKIAQHIFLQEYGYELKIKAAHIFKMLSNHPGVLLAQQRGALPGNYREHISWLLEQDFLHAEVRDELPLFSDRIDIRGNTFQKTLWNVFDEHSRVAVSAPTSAGKSYAVILWLLDLMQRSNDPVNIINVTPTRALISQVSADLYKTAKILGIEESLNVVSIPDQKFISREKSNVFVLTQERLHYGFSIKEVNSNVDTISAAVIDEAQKINEDTRGVLLQSMIEFLEYQYKPERFILLTPLTENPAVLLEDFRGERVHALESQEDTVTQNLFWMSQVRGKPSRWKLELCVKDQVRDVQQLELLEKPNTVRQRLAYVAASVGADVEGNLVYVNGAAEVEQIAHLIAQLIEDEIRQDGRQEERNDIASLIRDVVHRDYALVECVKRGVAFHYGNMPLILRERIEEAFSQGSIRFLVCTSTLIEGVNTSCKNIFLRGPKKGIRRLMGEDDFWNLAGRAGRWGKDFAGNIFCVDAYKKSLWAGGEPPRYRRRFKLNRATDEVFKTVGDLEAFVDNEGKPERVSNYIRTNAVFSYLLGVYVNNGNILSAPWASRYDEETLMSLENLTEKAYKKINLPGDVFIENPGINPFGMRELYDRFGKNASDIEMFMIADPVSDDAVDSFASVFRRCAKYLKISKFGTPGSGLEYRLAITVVDWLNGYPLERMINNRYKNLAEKAEKSGESPPDFNAILRTTLEDVEQVARFEAPRSLRCYNHILKIFLVEEGREDLSCKIENFDNFFEFGVSSGTALTLIGLGISRSSAIEIAGFLAKSDLSVDEARRWLASREWERFSLTRLARREIENVLASAA